MTSPINKPGVSADALVPDSLLAGDFDIVSGSVTLISGQNLARGSVLGIITASNKATLSLAASADGSQVPNCILADDVDASGGDAVAPIYKTGEFNEAALTIGTGHTAASIRETLRGNSIFLKSVMGA
ncbi:MAG: head decoration protein [Rhodospirillales bacterium]|jgi:hypothetical protein